MNNYSEWGNIMSAVFFPNYEYLLFVGPGRSGTDYLYNVLRESHHVEFPEIKEGYYYRSPGRYMKMRRKTPDGVILGDGANLAYLDLNLVNGVPYLHDAGERILVVVTIRDHVERTRSMMQFDASRGRGLWRRGSKRLERFAVSRRLTPEQLRYISRLGVDVAVLDFRSLTAEPLRVVNWLARQCHIPEYKSLPDVSTNPSEQSRSPYLSAVATLGARGLRKAGLRRTLQDIKDNETLHNLAFKPGGDQPTVALTPEHIELLDRDNAACWQLVYKNFSQVEEGIYLRVVDADPPLVV